MSAQRLRGVTGERVALEGVVAVAPVAEGSHSEHVGPVLRTRAGDARLYLIGDDPFANDALRAFVGAQARVEGVWRNGVVRVEPGSLTRLEAPGSAPASSVPHVATGDGGTSAPIVAPAPAVASVASTAPAAVATALPDVPLVAPVVSGDAGAGGFPPPATPPGALPAEPTVEGASVPEEDPA